MNTVNHPVHVVYVFESSANWLPQGSAFSNLKKMMMTTHPNQDFMVFVRKNRMLEMFIQAVASVYKLNAHMSRYHFVQTKEEALGLVQRRDALSQS